jgi:hypothetical protein
VGKVYEELMAVGLHTNGRVNKSWLIAGKLFYILQRLGIRSGTRVDPYEFIEYVQRRPVYRG